MEVVLGTKLNSYKGDGASEGTGVLAEQLQWS